MNRFKQWPEYVREHLDEFAGKRVVAYCTGGVRCERGTGILKRAGVCKDVMQMRGGIHSYLEWAEEVGVESLFRGPLFVFDDRLSIRARGSGPSADVLGKCFHCSSPWDAYELCTSSHCRMLVLSCPACREKGIGYCCSRCNDNHLAAVAAEVEDKENGITEKKRRPREQCACTDRRARQKETKN